MGVRLYLWLLLAVAAAFPLRCPAQDRTAELIRDTWGVPHVFAAHENDGFYGVGYASAEDRILQMELFRRRASGRLAEVLGAKWVESDRKFRLAGVHRHCLEAAAQLPEEMRGWLASYAAGVNAYVSAHPETVQRRMAPLGILPEPWTEADSVCSFWAVAEIFDSLFDEGAAPAYFEFRTLAAQVGEDAALAQRGMIIDDAAAVVPESEMAKNTAVYQRLKAAPKTPGYWFRSLPDDLLRFSHAWAVAGSRSATGKPLLESDPQTSVNFPALWYEFHLSAGRFDVRGIGFAGSPAMLIGFNRKLAWGASALGAGSNATFLEKYEGAGQAYLYAGRQEHARIRRETILVRNGAAVEETAATTRHGFVFDRLARQQTTGYWQVSYHSQIQHKSTSLRGLLGMMGAGDWSAFRASMEHYDSPGLHIVYADTAGHLGYQTLVRVPKTRWTRRMALEGWTGEHEVDGRIPLDEMPHLLNPASAVVSHANNLPVGSWYPYDLGIGTGGTGHSARSLRLVELLRGNEKHSVESFEATIHRDDVQASVAKLFPIARRISLQTSQQDGVPELLAALDGWDLRFRSRERHYAAAMALAGSALTPFRRSAVSAKVGGGEGGISHLARRLEEQYGNRQDPPVDPDVRAYLLEWLKQAAAAWKQTPVLRATHSMPYQANGPMGFGSLEPRFDLVSPLLSCTQVGTIWSQHGNSYTQIVDLADPDNSRSLLPPGLSEDPQSPWHANQIDLWVAGGTHPAPLSRQRVEQIAASRLALSLGTLPAQGRVAVVNSASFAAEAVISPGAIASVFGARLSARTAAAAGFPLPRELASTQVTINGVPAPLLYVSPAQINFQALYGITGAAIIRVLFEGKETASAAVRVAPAAPGVFTLARGAETVVAVLNEDGSLHSAVNPAARGSILQIFLTGLGDVSPPLEAGAAAGAAPLHHAAQTPKVYADGIPCDVVFAGLAPGHAGLYQVNARVAAQAAAGRGVPLQVAAGYLESREVTIYLR